MEHFIVEGMTCAACQARVEKAVNKVPGVKECAVSLLTNSMGVDGTASTDEIIKAVEDAGYTARLRKGAEKSNPDSRGFVSASVNVVVEDETDVLADKTTPILIKRLTASILFLALLMYISMGYMMWGFPLPERLADNHVAIGIIELLLTMAVMVINQRFFISGFKSLLKGAPNMDTLVALGSGAAFVYSTYALLAMTEAQLVHNHELVMHYMDELYFESAAMILTLITVGKVLEARSKGKTTDALKSLMKLASKQATILVDGREKVVPIQQVKKGDYFIVKPGENIPVDGLIVEGSSAVNEAALTGESIPVDKLPGMEVSAATLNTEGFLKCEALRVGEDTTFSQIIRMVSDAAATKAPIAKVADKVSGVFVPTVIVIAVITTFAWILAGKDVGYALARGISVLVISCPCALGLATPVAIMVGNGVGARNGLLFKTAVSLEQTGKMQIVALDKTGTITEGKPEVTDIFFAESENDNDLLCYAYILEKRSEHPLAKAVVRYVETKKEIDREFEQIINEFESMEISDYAALPGNGLKAVVNNCQILGGNRRFTENAGEIPANIIENENIISEQGKTPLYFMKNGRLLGMMAVADTIKEDSNEAISELKSMGMHVVMLTGDNERSANAIGRQVGVDEVIAGVLPKGKESKIRELQKKGKVLMVGDGINDAPALTAADMGIAIGAGTDIAIDAADVVLMKNRLTDVPAAIRLSRKTLNNIHENLFWAFFYNCIGIPLAAGVFIPVFGWTLNPMFGAAAMSLSSFCVVTNALRLNLVNIYSKGVSKKDNNTGSRTGFQNNNTNDNKSDIKKNNKDNINMEDLKMEKIMTIEGMMCGHCESRVKKTLEAIEGVKEAIVSHERKEAVVKLSSDVSDEVLKNAVEAQDYKVIKIRQ
ncbi:MAG: heavy metal translocating P-type ATPase [Lachnospira sp.]